MAQGAPQEDCPCSRFACGERSSELALRCSCCGPRGVRPGRTPLHVAAAAGHVEALTAGLQLLVPQGGSQPGGSQPGGAQQAQGGSPAQGGGSQDTSSGGAISKALPELPVDGAGNTPLHNAAAAAQPAAVAALLQHCAPGELERRNAFGLTPLLSLAANPRPGQAPLDTLRALLNAGADLFARTAPPHGAGMDACGDDTALSLVAQHARPGAGAAPLVRALLGAGMDPLEATGAAWTSPLEYACAAGDVGVFAPCLWSAQWLPTFHKHGIQTSYLLPLAAAHGSIDVVHLLLEPPAWLRPVLARQEEASSDHFDEEVDSLPDWSVLQGPDGPDGSRLPSDDGSGGQPSQSCPAPDPNEPLFADWLLDYCLNIAVARGDLDLSRRLVAAGASATQMRCSWSAAHGWERDLESMGWQGRFPQLHGLDANLLDPSLNVALQERKLPMAEWLIKRTGASFPRLDSYGRTALHWAAALGHTHLLRWLLPSGQYRMRGEGDIRAIDVDDADGWSALAYALARGDPEAVELLCRHGTSVPTERHHKTSPLVAALLVEEPAARRAILSTLLQHDAPVDPYDVLNAIRASQPAELQQLMEARAAAAEGGQPFDAQDAAVLLLKAVSWDRADCLEVLLAWGLSPQVNIKSGDGRKRTLLKTWFNINCAMWTPQFGYSEAEDRLGWQQRADGGPECLCASPTRQRALRIGQALVLAGASLRGVLTAIDAMLHAAPELQEVADRLRHPTWVLEQHCLWPAAFKAAAAELLCCLHAVDRQLAGAPAAGAAMQLDGQAAQQAQEAWPPAEAQHPAFPAWARQRIVQHLGAGWEWPEAAE